MSEPEAIRPRDPYSIFPCSACALVVAIVCAVLFVCFARRPLWHTDLWGHLAYGRAIMEQRSLPEYEPFLTHAVEGKFVDTAWLSQVLGYEVFQAFGVGGIQWLYGASIAFCAWLLIHDLMARTKSALWPLVGGAIFLYVDWQQLLIVRPQLAGLICFVALFVRLNGSPLRVDWFYVPCLFALWANLHGSFVMGWGLIAAQSLGRLIDVRFREDATSESQVTRSWFPLLLMLLLAVLATLVNPYGIDLHREICAIAANPNLTDLIEWQPLLTHPRQGLAFSLAVVAITIAGWRSRQRSSTAEILLLVVLGIATLWTSRMILWWAPVAGWYVARHAGSLRQPNWEGHLLSKLDARSWPLTVVLAVVPVAAVGCTPEGVALWTGNPLAVERYVSVQTPVGAAAYLAKNRPKELIFNTYEWGDYLIWSVPGPIQVFVHSHAHLVPAAVWQDYILVSRGRPGWDSTLEKYGINVVVIDPNRHDQSVLAKAMRADSSWKVTFEDERSIIFERTRKLDRHP